MGFIDAYKSDGGGTWREMVAGNDCRTKLRGKRWREKFGGRVEGGKKLLWAWEKAGRNAREKVARLKLAGESKAGKNCGNWSSREAEMEGKKIHAAVHIAKADKD